MTATHSLAGWMVYAVCVAALVSVMAAAAEELVRGSGLRVRSLWGASLAAALVLPLVAWGLARQPTATHAPEGTIAPNTSISAQPPEIVASDAEAAGQADTERPSPTSWSLSAIRIPSLARFDAIARLIAIGSPLAYLAWLLVAWMSLRTRRRNWREGTFDGAAVLLSPDFGPAIVGVRHPRIVIPLWAVELPVGERRLLLAHERAHLAARDERGLTAALCSLAIMPWNVALWHQLRRYRLAVELDCDARVLRAKHDVRQYGQLLLNVAHRAPAGSAMVAALVERPSALRRRIEAMTTGGARTPAHRLLRDGAIVALAAQMACTIAPPAMGPSASPDRALDRGSLARLIQAPISIPQVPTHRAARDADSLAGIAPVTYAVDTIRPGTDGPGLPMIGGSRPVNGEGIHSDSAPAPGTRTASTIGTVTPLSSEIVNLQAQPVPTPEAASDIIRGLVTGPDSQPLEGVLITAKNRVSGVTVTTRTRPDGHYNINFINGGGDYLMTFAAPGFEERTIPLRRQADEAVLVFNVVLSKDGGRTDCASPRGARPIEIFMPPASRTDLLAGTKVAVDYFVNERGDVDSVHFQPTADSVYNAKLAAMVGVSRFTPGVRADGTPVAMRCTLTYDFGR